MADEAIGEFEVVEDSGEKKTQPVTTSAAHHQRKASRQRRVSLRQSKAA